MNLTIAPCFGKRPTPSRRRFWRSITAICCIVFLTGIPAHADSVQINNVIQTLTNQGSTNLKLTLISQDPAPSGTKGATTSPAGPRNDNANDPKTDIVVSSGQP